MIALASRPWWQWAWFIVFLPFWITWLLRWIGRPMSEPRTSRSAAWMVGGSDPYNFGSDVWPGLSKLTEEMGELQQVLGKIIATGGDMLHWDGDLSPRLLAEMGDVKAALETFARLNLNEDELVVVAERCDQKNALFDGWHQNPEGDRP